MCTVDGPTEQPSAFLADRTVKQYDLLLALLSCSYDRQYFLFTSSDTFAVGCIVQPQHTAKTEPQEFLRLE